MTSNSTIPKVLFLNPWDRFIGPNRYLLEMLRHAPGLARESTVVFHKENGAAEDYDSLGCRIAVWPEVEQIRGELSIANCLKLARSHTIGLRKVIELVRNVKPDLMVSNTEQLWIGGLASRFVGVPHIKIFHAMSFTYRFERRPHLLKTYLHAFTFESDKVLAVSETLRGALVSGGLDASKVSTVSNPIPVRHLRLASNKPLPGEVDVRLERRHPILVNAGVIFPRKGQDQLIEGIGRIREEFPKVLCLIAGRVGEDSGFENTKRFFELLHERVKRLGLTDHVLFLGEIDYLPSLLHRADLYVHTSRTESFGRVVAESLICGTPVVSYDVGAIAEVAGPGAVLVEAGDVSALAAAVLDLMRHPEKRYELANEGGRHVEQLYDGSVVAQELEGFLATEATNNKQLS